MKIATKESVEYIYGDMPKRPLHLSTKTDSCDKTFAAGKAELRKEAMYIEIEDKLLSLPFVSVVPRKGGVIPSIIMTSESGEIPNKHLPAEEIIDRGYAIYLVKASDVCELSDKKAGLYSKLVSSRRKRNTPGKIAVMAWALERLGEHVCSLEYTEKSRVALAGHGIFARVALLAGERSNATHIIANGATALPIPFTKDIPRSGFTVKNLPQLYSPAFVEEPVYDELKELLRSTKTKKVLLGSAEEGDGASIEYESSIIGEIIPTLMEKTAKRKAPIKALWQDESCSYHVRSGVDYFSRDDWKIYLDYIDNNPAK